MSTPAHATAGVGDTAGGRVVTDQLDTAHGAVLYLDDITVSFDGFKALNKLNLTIDVGELRCVIGPNGAGKTTLLRAVAGLLPVDEGRVHLDGGAPRAAAAAHAIGLVAVVVAWLWLLLRSLARLRR